MKEIIEEMKLSPEVLERLRRQFEDINCVALKVREAYPTFADISANLEKLKQSLAGYAIKKPNSLATKKIID